jgi:hypothetical protein
VVGANEFWTDLKRPVVTRPFPILAGPGIADWPGPKCKVSSNLPYDGAIPPMAYAVARSTRRANAAFARCWTPKMKFDR